MISDTPCDIIEVKEDKHIKCQVAAMPAVLGPNFEGNRGVNFEYWTNVTVNNLDNILWFDSLDSGYYFQRLDETVLDCFDANKAMGKHAGKLTFYFKPPHSGHYKFDIGIYGLRGANVYLDGVSIQKYYLNKNRFEFYLSIKSLLMKIHIYLNDIKKPFLTIYCYFFIKFKVLKLTFPTWYDTRTMDLYLDSKAK